MKIGIVGFGFVGSALASVITDKSRIIKIDPKLNTNIDDLANFKPHLTFICLPTPMSDNGTQDISSLTSVLNEIKEADIDTTIVIKSTISPDNLKKLLKINNDLILNPEFLREKFANEDMRNSKFILIGKRIENYQILKDFYTISTICNAEDFYITDIATASLIKYSINSYLATKVIFFNELKNIFNESESSEDWENVIKIISSDERIGSSHMMVPGHDNRHGFGGACFPKDTKALYEYSKKIKKEFSLLNKAITINNHIRAEYNTLTDRELEQNVNYKIDNES